MGWHRLQLTWGKLLVAIVVANGVTSTALGAAVELATLAAFARANGSEPYGTLLLTPDGSFYGTTFRGGTNAQPIGLGTIFRINPTGEFSVLLSFNTTNGANPYSGLTAGPDGRLYGTTWQGGSSNLGTLFRLNTNNNLLTTLISFTNGNGAKPSARLVRGHRNFLYGTTQLGGVTNLGTVFRLTTNGVLTTVASFRGTNGANPYAEVTQGVDGHLYGTTVNGGVAGAGVVFRATTNGLLTSLHSFTGADGANPYGGLVQDATGTLFGTTAYGGAMGDGTIFKITTNGAFTILRSFAGGADGANPWASLLHTGDGFLYGTTILGGGSTGVPRGTVFQISTNGTFAPLVAFDYDTNGISPYAGLITDSGGKLYGTTWQGGPGLRGTVFRLTPSPQRLRASLPSYDSLQLSWDTWLGYMYQVQFRTNVGSTAWQDFGSPFRASNSPVTVNFLRSGSARYFRVQMNAVP